MGSGEEAIPSHGTVYEQSPDSYLLWMFSCSIGNYTRNLKSLPTQQFYKVPIQWFLNIFLLSGTQPENMTQVWINFFKKYTPHTQLYLNFQTAHASQV